MTEHAVDLEAIHARYARERQKRLRSDGNDQYMQPTGNFARLLEDPYTIQESRPPVTDCTTLTFVGAGFSGLTTGAALSMVGIDDVRLVDKGGDVGGTWYWNRYPGAQCDTAAMIYMPLLEETGHVPTEKYTKAPEILEHSKRIAEKFNLYDNALFHTEVTAMRWDDEASHWVVQTNRDDEFTAKYVALGVGPLHRAKLPAVEGIDSFEGHTFHTTRWDYDYTGGSPNGEPMDRLGGKRVGIIGTGATSVQCVPHLGKASGELFVFQRTPSSIDIRNNHPIDPDWFAELEPGWQDKWLLNFTTLQTGGFADEDLVMDGWTDIAIRIRDRIVADGVDFTPEEMLKAYHDSDDEKMGEIRARVEAIVDDPATAEHLKPWYRQLCKRPCFHDEYLDAYNLANTHLIDTDGKGVQKIDATGVWVGDEHYELDCIIFASGFEVGTGFTRRAGFDPVGRDGVKLSEYWADGMLSLHGMHVHGFPNMFVVGFSQAANLISNIPHNLTEAGRTIAAIVSHAEAVGATRVEAESAAEQDWVDMLVAGGRTFGGDPDCTPGYYNNEGRPRELADTRNSSGFPDGPVAFFEFIKGWRTNGRFTGLVIE